MDSFHNLQSEFAETPTFAFVNCKKAQLMYIAGNYGIVVAEKSCKDELRKTVLFSLFENGVLHKEELRAESVLLLMSAPAVV